MSKDRTPEVGDVWKVTTKQWEGYTETFKVIVVNMVNFVHPFCLTEDCQPFYMDNEEADFTYLGKSKASIDDLFKTEIRLKY